MCPGQIGWTASNIPTLHILHLRQCTQCLYSGSPCLKFFSSRFVRTKTVVNVIGFELVFLFYICLTLVICYSLLYFLCNQKNSLSSILFYYLWICFFPSISNLPFPGSHQLISCFIFILSMLYFIHFFFLWELLLALQLALPHPP